MKDFEKSSRELFDKIVDFIESCHLVDDIELTESVIQFSVQDVDFVINKHRCSKEVWLSSKKTGPHHFKPSNNGWLNDKGLEILNLLGSLVKDLNGS